MKITIIALSAAGLIALAPAASAMGVSSKTPGHQMKIKGSVKGSPGASGYAPGHLKHAKGPVKSYQRASGYAPGQTTGANIRTRTDTSTTRSSTTRY